MKWHKKTCGDLQSFSWGDYRGHSSGKFWTAYKFPPLLVLGKHFKTGKAAAEACQEHSK